jgi:hypothetical protein
MNSAEWGARGTHLQCQGFAAGDPLSPMLFLVMDVLNNMFRKANTWSVL